MAATDLRLRMTVEMNTQQFLSRPGSLSFTRTPRPRLFTGGVVAFLFICTVWNPIRGQDTNAAAPPASSEATATATSTDAATTNAAPDATAPLTNTLCPVLTDEPVDPDIYVDYQGKRVYLCCSMCRRRFLQDPEKYLANLPQFAASSTETFAVATTDSDAPAEVDIPDAASQSAASSDITEDTAPADTPVDARSLSTVGESREASAEAAAMGSRTTAESADRSLESQTDEGPPPTAVRFLGKFHPIVIHFPIALLLAAALAEWLSVLSGAAFWSHAGRYTLILGAIGAAIAAPLGIAAEESTSFPASLEWVVELHEILGITTAIVAVVAMVLNEIARRTQHKRWRTACLVLLTIAALLVAVTGHFGAALVYGLDHFSL